MKDLKEYFRSLSPQQQLVFFVIVMVIIYLIYKNVNTFFQVIGQKAETAGEVAAFQAQGQKKTYSNGQYNSFATRLYYAMSGMGTDEDELASVFGSMKNDLDVVALNEAFGAKDGYTLQQWLREDLDAGDMQTYVNGILAAKGITKNF